MSNIQDTANQALQQMLTMAVNGLQGAVDFSKAQIPDVVHQMLVWNAVESIIAQIFSLIIIGAAFYLFYQVAKNRDDRDSIFSECGDLSFAGVILLFVSVALILFFLFNFLMSFDWLQIWLAPKYYILQQAAQLVKS